MPCIFCGKSDRLYETMLYVMEWSDNMVGNRQVQQSRICGAVRVKICEDCIREHIAKMTKGFLAGKKVKEAANEAITTRDYGQFINQIAARGLKAVIDRPNAGKNKAFAAWAAANAAEHLLNENFIPAECVTACFVQEADGNAAIIPNEPIRYMLARPSVFKFIEYAAETNKFDFITGEQFIDPKWLLASENNLKICHEYLNKSN